MNLKEEIIYNFEVNEMAQQHFDDDVVKFIKSGEFEKAAERYIDLHGTAKLAQKATATTGKLKIGNFAKTLKADPEEVKKITKSEWEKFERTYTDLMGTSSEGKRKYTKTKGTVDPGTGKIKTSSQSGATRAVSINKLEAKIQKIAGEFQKQLQDKELEDENKEEIKSHLEGLTILGQALQYTKKGKGTLPLENKEDVKKLEDRYKKIEAALGKKMNRPIAKYADEPSAEDKTVERAVRKVKKRLGLGLGNIDDIEDEVESHRKHIKFKKEREARWRVPVEELKIMNIKGRMLAESYEYYGANFWENYIGSDLVRGFNKDTQLYGSDVTAEMYIDVFGEETAPIFKYMADNEELLSEAALVKGMFLFESYGLQNVNNYLLEVSVLTAGVGGAASKIAGAAKKGGLVGFLGGLWEKLRAFGKPLVKKLGLFASKGISWAKNIATQGLNWIHTNPIARIAVPVVALAGTVAGGIVLLNKLRKKAGKKRLSKVEEQQITSTVGRKSKELEKLNVRVA